MSPDSVEDQAKFAGKFDVPFPLLSDPGGNVAKQYGVWGKKKLYGKEFEGVTRSTFLIDPEGRVSREWRKVKVDGHVEEVLSAIP